MSDTLLFLTLILIFLSVPLLIFIIGAATFFAIFFFVQYLQTGDLMNLISVSVLMLIYLLSYLILKKVKNWFKEK